MRCSQYGTIFLENDVFFQLGGYTVEFGCLVYGHPARSAVAARLVYYHPCRILRHIFAQLDKNGFHGRSRKRRIQENLRMRAYISKWYITVRPGRPISQWIWSRNEVYSADTVLGCSTVIINPSIIISPIISAFHTADVASATVAMPTAVAAVRRK